MITLLPKQLLTLTNRQKLQYQLATAEKDYFLAIVSKIIAESELTKKIVFKGGTAIHHCYLEQSRFSEDLDFSSFAQDITLDEVAQVLESQPFLEVKDHHVSKATIKIERLKYSGVLDQPNSLKVEIDFIQNVILPARRMPYKNAWGIESEVLVMNVKEICSEKVRAMSDRSRYRDFYDWYLLNQQYNFSFTEIHDLLQQKETRKVISKESIMQNWQLAKAAKQQERTTVQYRDKVVDHDDWIENKLNALAFHPIPVNATLQKEDT